MALPTPITPNWHTEPARSLQAYLDDLLEQLRLLPPTSKARPALISRIRSVETELDARGAGK